MIETERLTLRAWRDTDAASFAAICADPEVMRHLDGPQTRRQVDAFIERQHASQRDVGYCFWVVEQRSDGSLLGFCGLRDGGHAGTAVPDELEIGWRLRRDAWGRGYAREAAAVSLAWGWRETARLRIAAWTVQANEASWRLMERLGMTRRPDLAFDHPAFLEGHPLRHLIVHAIDRPA